MKIEDALKGMSAIRSRGHRKAKDGAASLATNGEPTNDSVEITRASANINRLAEELIQLESPASSKVDAIRHAIAEGSYQVDEEAVADALVQTTMEQLRRHGRRK